MVLTTRIGFIAATGLVVFATGCPADDASDTGTSGGSTSTTGPTTTTQTTAGPTTVVDTGSTSSMATTDDTDTDPDTGSESGSESSSSTTGPFCDENVVELPGDMLFPEGIAAHSDGTLYVGSLTSGEILAITPCTEGTEDIVENLNDGSDTASAVGMLVDEANSILWVCSSDLTGVAAPAVQGIDLSDGSLLWEHLFDAGFCNDVAFDGDGNLYATESLASRIMRIEAADLLSNSDADEWSTDTLYNVPAGEFGLNGIAFDGTDTIYTVNFFENEMYTTVIQGNGNAANPDPVDLAGAELLGPDGMKLEAANTFLVVEGGATALTRYTIDAGAVDSAVRIDETFDVPTTSVIVDTNAWVVEGQLDHLLDPVGAGDPMLPFMLRRVSLE